MRRGLNIDGIKRKIDELKEANSKIAVRTSLIVGFPNESDKEFQDLYDFVEEIRFDRLGVFVYSEEKGTYGDEAFNDNIPKSIKQERMDVIMRLQNDINLKNNINLIGSTQKVIIDINTHDNKSIGRTFRDSPEIDNTVTINKKLKVGDFYDILIQDASSYNLIGKV